MEDESIKVAYWEKGKRVVTKHISQISKELAACITVELSNDENYAILGGSTNMDLVEGHPILAVVKFDESLALVHLRRLKDPSLKCIFKMKKLPDSDIIVVSGFDSLCLLRFSEEDTTLVELKQLSKFHSGEIFDFEIMNNKIFSISGRDSFIHKL